MLRHHTAKKAVRPRCGGNFSVLDQFRTNKGRLIQMIEGVRIISGNVHGDDCLLRSLSTEINFIHAVKAVSTSRRPKGNKFTVNPNIVSRRTRQTKNCFSRAARNRPKRKPKIHFLLSAQDPNGTRLFKTDIFHIGIPLSGKKQSQGKPLAL